MWRSNKNPPENKENKVESGTGTDRKPAPPPAQQQGNAQFNPPPPARPASPPQNNENQLHQHAPIAKSAITESEGMARDIKEGTLSGFFGNGTSLSGEVEFKGMLRIDGHVSGKVSSEDGTLIVSTNGLVEADVEVAVAQINGTLKGDIIATKRIDIGRVARLLGNIHTPALIVEEGAVFEGSCRMAEVPSSREAARKKMKELGISGKPVSTVV